jgi:hypothetical protein
VTCLWRVEDADVPEELMLDELNTGLHERRSVACPLETMSALAFAYTASWSQPAASCAELAREGQLVFEKRRPAQNLKMPNNRLKIENSYLRTTDAPTMLVGERAPISALPTPPPSRLAVFRAQRPTDKSPASLAEATELVRRGRGERRRPARGWDNLTPTEARMVELVAAGLPNREIAAKLLTRRPEPHPPRRAPAP